MVLGIFILSLTSSAFCAVQGQTTSKKNARTSTKSTTLKTAVRPSKSTPTQVLARPVRPETALTKKITSPQAKEEEKKKLNASITIAPTTNAVDYQDGSRADSLDSLIILGYDFGVVRLGSLFILSQDLRSQELNVADPQVTGTFQPLNPDSAFLISPYVLTTIPVSKEARMQTLQGALGAGLKFGFGPQVFVKELKIGGSISFTRNFYEYDISSTGKVNTEYNSTQKISAEYAMGDFFVSAIFFNINGLTPSGALKQKFIHGEEFGYNFSEHFAIALGHQNAGPGLKPNQMDSNIDFFNERSSQVYLGVTYAY